MHIGRVLTLEATSIDEVSMDIQFALSQEYVETVPRLVHYKTKEKWPHIKNQPSIDTIKITTEESDLLKMGNQNL